MYAGVNCYCFNLLLVESKTSLARIINFVGADTEAERIEILQRYWKPAVPVVDQAADAREAIEGHGLAVSCYTLQNDFAVYDPPASRHCIELAVAQFDVAEALGTDTIRIDPRTSLSVPPDQADRDEIVDRIVPLMAEIADAAADRGITVGVENHGRLLGRTADVQRIVEGVDRPNFGVNLDPTNFFNVFGEDHLEATRRLASKVVHVHLKDFHRRDAQPDEDGWSPHPAGGYARKAVGGEGDADWPEIIRILKSAGYSGTIDLEVAVPEDIWGSVARGVSNLKRIIAEVESA